jgi:hypothetical protein
MVGIEEFGSEIGEGLVIKLKLALERSVRNPTTLTEECQDLIEHGIKVHYSSSACLHPLLAGLCIASPISLLYFLERLSQEL